MVQAEKDTQEIHTWLKSLHVHTYDERIQDDGARHAASSHAQLRADDDVEGEEDDDDEKPAAASKVCCVTVRVFGAKHDRWRRRSWSTTLLGAAARGTQLSRRSSLTCPRRRPHISKRSLPVSTSSSRIAVRKPGHSNG